MNRSDILGVSPSPLSSILNSGFKYPNNTTLENNVLSKEVSYRHLHSAVKDQSDGQHCVSFAVVGCAEYNIKNGIGGGTPVPNISLSETHLSHASEKRQGDCMPGMPLWHAVEAISYWGIVTSEAWPYDKKTYCSASPPNRNSTLWYRTPTWNIFSHKSHSDILNTMDSYSRGDRAIVTYSSDVARKALANGVGAYLIDIPVVSGHGWDEPTDGTILMPSSSSIKDFINKDVGTPIGTRGWHAIILTGFNDITRRFEFKNSWSSWWGSSGYGTIPYDYVSAFNREMWGAAGIRYEVRTGPLPGAL